MFCSDAHYRCLSMSEFNNKFSGRRVVLFCPKFFNYHHKIKEQLIEFGFELLFYDDRVSNSFLFKALLRLNWRFLINFVIAVREKMILKEMSSFQADYILFINPESPTVPFMRSVGLLVNRFGFSSKVIVYMWDSLKNKKNASAYIELVDRFVTFDPKDASFFKLDFLPLFYVDEYALIGKNITDLDTKYDLGFVGTLHSGRSLIFDKIVESIGARSSYRFLYCPSWIVFFIRKYILREFKCLSFKDVSFAPLSFFQTLNLVSSFKCVLDVPHEDQNGLTMRMFEMLGAKKKIITTSIDVVNYDFYRKSNIFILKDFNTDGLENFFDTPYESVDEAVYKKYSIESWLNTLLS